MLNGLSLNLPNGCNLCFLRLILDLILCGICINNLDDRIECIFTKFLENTWFGEEQISQRKAPLFREDLCNKHVMMLKKNKCEFWAGDRKMPSSNTDWCLAIWIVSLLRRTWWSPDVQEAKLVSESVSMQKWRQAVSWATSAPIQPADQGMHLLQFTWLVSSHLEVSGLGPPVQEREWKIGKSLVWGHYHQDD